MYLKEEPISVLERRESIVGAICSRMSSKQQTKRAARNRKLNQSRYADLRREYWNGETVSVPNNGDSSFPPINRVLSLRLGRSLGSKIHNIGESLQSSSFSERGIELKVGSLNSVRKVEGNVAGSKGRTSMVWSS